MKICVTTKQNGKTDNLFCVEAEEACVELQTVGAEGMRLRAKESAEKQGLDVELSPLRRDG